ncbi:MAG: Zn-dependent hydrolase [Bacteroidales bacterium]|nr:Zn-dependent hydrolase [Bacteroidales bacterium]
MKKLVFMALSVLLIAASGCKSSSEQAKSKPELQNKVEDFVPFELKTDLSVLSENQVKMIPMLIEIADIMNELFWVEAYGDKSELLDTITDPWAKQWVNINYGPWERLNNNQPYTSGIGEKPKGANFYPVDMTPEEFEAFTAPDKNGLYTFIRRNDAGELISIPYHVFFKEQILKASELLQQASELAIDPGFKKYLELRSNALLTDDYFESDMAWMDMKSNIIDFVVGPIETYEDQLYGYKAAHEAYILIKDIEWTDRLSKYAALLPILQKGLPVEEKYKTESPGDNSDLGAYDVIYYAGDCNAGSKTIAINLPNDPEVQLKKGSRRLQLKNSMQAKFEKILVPIAHEIIVEEQQKHITFDAFFANTMFHEVAHGLGIKNTLTGKGEVREALKELSSSFEEGKADILGLYLVTKLHEMGEIQVDLMDNFTTFLAGIFRSIRFGSSSAHGKANLMRFNYFKEKGAFTQHADGRYSVNFEKMQEAMNSLSELIIVTQGEGDYEAALKILNTYGVLGDDLKTTLNLINSKDIPVDIVFEQDAEVLGL